MELEKANELIADFIGERLKPSTLGPQQWKFPWCEGYFPSTRSMRFHESFDWVIPVYRKIQKECHMTANGPRELMRLQDAILEADPSKCMISMVKFIQLRNAQPFNKRKKRGT